MTTNGYSVAAIADADLAAFKDIEFSLDYPTEAEQDNQRGPGNWRLLHEQAARCRRLGVPVTFIAVMMQSNFDRLADIAAIAKAYDAPLRINVYQSVRTDKFALTYEQYWSGFERLFERTDVIAIGEPLGARHGRSSPAPRRLRRGDGAGHAARDRAAVRVLARRRRAARHPARCGPRCGGDKAVRRCSLRAPSVC